MSFQLVVDGKISMIPCSLDLLGNTFKANPGLAAELRRKDVSTIVAFGIQSEYCVLSTCQGALEAGFKVVLLHGAHSTYDACGRSAAVIEAEVEDQLRRDQAEVVDWEAWQLQDPRVSDSSG